MQEFIEDANGKMMNFSAETIEKNNDFAKESINKILLDLQNGFDDSITFKNYGTITYDNSQQSFIYQKNTGEQKLIEESALNKFITLAIDNSEPVYGNSKKV